MIEIFYACIIVGTMFFAMFPPLWFIAFGLIIWGFVKKPIVTVIVVILIGWAVESSFDYGASLQE